MVLLTMLLLFVNGCSAVKPDYVEVKTDVSTFEGRFYYEQLSENEKLVYREIYEGVMDEKEQICTHSDKAEKANKTFLSVVYDFPEIFWVDGSATSTTHGVEGKEDSYTILEPEYIYTGEQKEKMKQEIDAVVASVVSNAPTDNGEYGKIKYVYEYLINEVVYVENAPDGQNLYSALVNHSTVCAGYAKANQYILNKLGVECTYIFGTAVSEETTDNHAWNIVKCDGKYYYVDLTWADPLPAEEDASFQYEMVYDYLCCSQREIGASHTKQDGYQYPECTSDDLNYYRMNGMFYESVDKKQLTNATYYSIDQKEGHTIYKFATRELYEQGITVLEKEVFPEAAQYLCKQYNLQKVAYNYVEDDMTCKITVYWSYQ